jgi:hypothetical protein
LSARMTQEQEINNSAETLSLRIRRVKHLNHISAAVID